MTETLIEMQQELEVFVQRRRRIEEELAAITDPDDRKYVADKLARFLDHEATQRDFVKRMEFIERLEPLMKEAMAVLDTGDQTTTGDCLKWHAARGNQFAQDLLAQMNDPEAIAHGEEIEAAFAWHPAWHKVDEHSWGCDTPDDPEVWEIDKLLAQYRRHLSTSKSAHRPSG